MYIMHMDVSIHRIQLQNKKEFHMGQLDMGSTKLLIHLAAAVLACTNNYGVPNVSEKYTTQLGVGDIYHT